MDRSSSSDSVPVATAAPLLRVALFLMLMLATVAGVLVAADAHIGWLTLSLALVAGPVAVVVEGRSRDRQPAPAMSGEGALASQA
jgi:cytochrome c oxidase subunit IV